MGGSNQVLNGWLHSQSPVHICREDLYCMYSMSQSKGNVDLEHVGW